MSNTDVIQIPPHHYIHVLDSNSNTTDVVVGPQTFTRPAHMSVVLGPEKMVHIPPSHYCIIANPVVRDEKQAIVRDQNGIALLKFSDQEVRFEQEPFPLYPGEALSGRVSKLPVVAENTALRLRAIRDVEGHPAGDEWLHRGPCTYRPTADVEIINTVRASVISPDQALRLRARRACVTSAGDKKAGEEWLVRQAGDYMPEVNEEVVRMETAHVLTPLKALQLRATRTFTDVYGAERKAGSEWLVTLDQAPTHILDVYEELVREVRKNTLSSTQYCVVLDPFDEAGKQHFGGRKVVRGVVSFFLRPGESLEAGIQDAYILGDQQALLLSARLGFVDGTVKRAPGDRWMIRGPLDYIPPVEVTVLEVRQAIPLDESEGIYVRDIKSGKVRAVVGETYLLNENEDLWYKELSPNVAKLLESGAAVEPAAMQIGMQASFSAAAPAMGTRRDKSRVATYRVPHNSCIQVYDYKLKTARIIFGPELVLLQPDEEITVMSLSGGKPKRPAQIKTLCLLLGPDFMTDVVTVETSDHARLSLQLSYNWHFEVDRNDPVAASNLFSVPDFVGDCCKAIASRVRGIVAATPFDHFHKNSAGIINKGVFGDSGTALRFESNGLVVDSVDIQNVEPVDQKTRDSLQRSVQLAIEITTNSLEAEAKQAAETEDQKARGLLERQRISDKAEAEKVRMTLLALQAESNAVASQGQQTAMARSRAEAAEIDGEAAVKLAALKDQASKIESDCELAAMTAHQEQEIKHQGELDKLEIARAAALAEIDTMRFRETVAAIGADTIRKMATAGPEMQAKLLEGLGLNGYLVTDGNSPINLFNTANGLIGGM